MLGDQRLILVKCLLNDRWIKYNSSVMKVCGHTIFCSTGRAVFSSYLFIFWNKMLTLITFFSATVLIFLRFEYLDLSGQLVNYQFMCIVGGCYQNRRDEANQLFVLVSHLFITSNWWRDCLTDPSYAMKLPL